MTVKFQEVQEMDTAITQKFILLDDAGFNQTDKKRGKFLLTTEPL